MGSFWGSLDSSLTNSSQVIEVLPSTNVLTSCVNVTVSILEKPFN